MHDCLLRVDGPPQLPHEDRLLRQELGNQRVNAANTTDLSPLLRKDKDAGARAILHPLPVLRPPKLPHHRGQHCQPSLGVSALQEALLQPAGGLHNRCHHHIVQVRLVISEGGEALPQRLVRSQPLNPPSAASRPFLAEHLEHAQAKGRVILPRPRVEQAPEQAKRGDLPGLSPVINNSDYKYLI